MRLSVDSGLVFRGVAEAERTLIFIEDSGWSADRYSRAGARHAHRCRPYIVELGVNLLTSCPSGGVLAHRERSRGSSRSGTAACSAPSPDIVPIRPASMRPTPSTAGAWPRRWAWILAAGAAASGRGRGQPHPLPEPGDRLAAVPALSWRPYRLVRVSRAPGASPDALSITELLKASRQGATPWVQDVRGVYEAAARSNALLCSSLLAFVGERRPRHADERTEMTGTTEQSVLSVVLTCAAS